MRRLVFAAMMTLMLTVMAVPAFAQDAPAAGAAVQSPTAMLTESDNMWKHRNVSGNAQRSLDLAQAALAAGGDAFEANWRIARGAFWVAEQSNDKKVKERIGWIGWEAGLKAQQLQPNRVEGFYFGVIALGQYSIGCGVMKAIGKGVQGKFERAGGRAIAINAAYDFGGPDRAMGVYWRDLPRIARNLEKAERHIKASIAHGDTKIRSHFYLAEIYLMTDRRELARTELEKCSQMDPNAEDYADGIIYKRKCSDLLRREFTAAN